MKIEVSTVGFGAGTDALPGIDGLIEAVTEELALRIQARTPVDTGNARDGWNIVGPGDIVSHVPYIQYLEYGHSQQAPAGMIRISLEEVPQIVEKYIQEQKRKAGK